MLSKKALILLSLIFVLFTACDGDVEINVPEFIEPPNGKLQVDFDEETWIAESITATVIEGVINIKASKNNNQEIIILNLLSDQIGSYDLDPAEFRGSITYRNTEDIEDDFSSISGTTILDVNDIISKTLAGEFFFTGSRLVQELDENGNPVLDQNDEPIYNEELKEFTNGEFQNINYTN